MSNPLLIFPKPSKNLSRTSLPPAHPPKFYGPAISRQRNRFETKINNLDTAIENEDIRISQSIVGLEPERLLVFEIKGDIQDFYRAVEKTEGMEFLGEYFIGEDDPDEDFIYRKTVEGKEVDDEKKIPRRLFLTINNQTALTELKRYWDNYKNNKGFVFGTTKFRVLFEQLNDIRNYSVKDRYEDTGIVDYFKERQELNEEELYFEIELTFRNDDDYLGKVYSHIKNLIEANNGTLIESSYTIIKEIKYHALIAKVPIKLFEELKEDTNITFFKCEQVLFFRPVGQAICNQQIEDNTEDINELIELSELKSLNEETIVAVLDGLPLQNHSLLKGKLVIDDPENIEENYPSKARKHGTSMSSLILYGDLNSNQVEITSRKIYLRPILSPIFNPITDTYCLNPPNNWT